MSYKQIVIEVFFEMHSDMHNSKNYEMLGIVSEVLNLSGIKDLPNAII